MVEKYFGCGTINVVYDNGFKGSILIKSDDGIIPIELNECEVNEFLIYPNIVNELINGSKLYINGTNGYIGVDISVGPYCEEKFFVSEYNCSNNNIYELLYDLDKRIKRKEKSLKKINKSY